MAIVTGMWLKGSKKRLGGTVIYQAMGQTRQRELASEVSNPRTEAQMNQRVKWSNLVNLYRSNQSWMKYAFETKKQNQSEYNKWMSLNVTNSRIYLTKQMASVGACVVDSYIVSQGSLPSIENTISQDGIWLSNIFTGNVTDLGGLSIGAFSAAVLANNPAIREGDQLSLIRMSQQTNADTGIPYVIVRKYELLINSSDTRLIGEFLPRDIVTIDTMGLENVLSIDPEGRAGGFVWILSRTIAGRTYVSSQKIVPVNNSALISQYSSDAAFRAAIDSYGSSEDAFLSTATANTAASAPVPAAILSIQIENVSFAVGSRVEVDEIGNGDSITATFNQNVPAAQGSILLNTNKGIIRADITGISGPVVQAEFVMLEDVAQNVVVYDITVDSSFGAVRAQFAVRNSDTQEGME